jgi:hypothetical protein
MSKQATIVPSQYDVTAGGRSVVIERRADGDVWAVLSRGLCLGADGEWHHEPMPSSRTAKWVASHRFTFDDAVERAKAALLSTEPGPW